MPSGHAAPLSAGAISALVAFTSSFVVVLTGLEAVGASPAQAASGLTAVSVLMGLGSIVLSLMTRLPITVAWSTPGAALLAATGTVEGGWPAAVGAFALVAVLIVLTGLVPALADLMARIPPALAQAMLAGVLLQLCLEPVLGLAANPLEVAPVVIVWLLALRLAPRWASPIAFAAAAVVIVVHLVSTGGSLPAGAPAGHLELTAPRLTPGAVIGIALPLYLVTMASQNVPGVAVLRSLGYEVPWRPAMLVTGGGSLLGAPLGGHGINLAAISAALAAGPGAGEDRSRRWIASLTSGIVMVVLGVLASAAAQLVALAPEGVVPAVAGLALLGTFVAAVKGALAREEEQLPAGITLLVAASGIAVAGISAAFWALLAGLVARSLLRARPRR
ncbi:benzoate transporter [Brachybacterium sp. SGAir0954]|uniref:benzoate/H(+) symporter BenE family transporter n=1 Tax=Brachybacterium sp. SGAir0954 TaxID=2571029 RepID=UPI0010CCE52B|nr:benzoate/H(+) symporter BenE family transporter [Brachybacterium sp. SGAir0954]QCR53886.1 benzoate transporter [Brachybacterium sp. SGAir0954]